MMKSVVTLAMCALFAVCVSLPAFAGSLFQNNNNQGMETGTYNGNNSPYQNNNRRGSSTGMSNRNNNQYQNNDGQGRGMGTRNRDNSLFGNRDKTESDTEKTSIDPVKGSKDKKGSKSGSRNGSGNGNASGNTNESKGKKVRVLRGSKSDSTEKTTCGTKVVKANEVAK